MSAAENYPRLPASPLPVLLSHCVTDAIDAEGVTVKVVRVNISMPSGTTTIFLGAAEADAFGRALVESAEQIANSIVQVVPKLHVPGEN